MTPGFGICRDEVVEVARCRTVGGGERVGDDVRDAEERQPSLEERRDSHLVRRIECTRVRAAALPGNPRVREYRERLQVGRLELERHAAGEIERPSRRGTPFRI